MSKRPVPPPRTLEAAEAELARLRDAARRVLSSAVMDVPLLVQFGQPLLAALEELKEALEG